MFKNFDSLRHFRVMGIYKEDFNMNSYNTLKWEENPAQAEFHLKVTLRRVSVTRKYRIAMLSFNKVG